MYKEHKYEKNIKMFLLFMIVLAVGVIFFGIFVSLLYAETMVQKQRCDTNISLDDKQYFHMPGAEYDSWYINDKGYIFSKKLIKDCKFCFSISKESYFAFSTWDPQNPIIRMDLPILLDNKLYPDGVALIENKKSFCIVAKTNLYFKLQHSLNKPV